MKRSIRSLLVMSVLGAAAAVAAAPAQAAEDSASADRAGGALTPIQVATVPGGGSQEGIAAN